MTASIQKFLIGASVAAGMSAIASAPAFAGTLKPTNIQFSNYQGKPQIETYLFGTPQTDVVNGVSRQVLNDITKDNVGKAIQALTDDSSATNVEIWYGSESPQAVGFTANLGTNTVKVESVTQADWAEGTLATKWFDGFLSAYDGMLRTLGIVPNQVQKNTILTDLKTNGLSGLGDPNVGSLTFDTQKSELKVDLVGHVDRTMLYVDTNPYVLDMRNRITVNGQRVTNPNYGKPQLDRNGRPQPNPNFGLPRPNNQRYNTGSVALNNIFASLALESFKQNKLFQFSEIAKVTYNDTVDYAFAFAATDSGAIAGNRDALDTTSHTGIYSWTKKYETASVPEPSTLLGLMAVGGLIAAQRKVLKKA
jgi:PEP-CTERM motif